jgi:hypothetical protein
VNTLVICRPCAGVDPARDIAPHARKELDALHELRAAGLLTEAYSPGGPGAILILTGDREQALRTLQRLPRVREALIDTELLEMHPFAGLGGPASEASD